MTQTEQNKAWRDRQAAMLRDNLKKRKALQKAQKQQLAQQELQNSEDK